MRFRALTAILVLAAAACSGQGGEQSGSQTQQAQTAAPATSTGTVHEVQMGGTAVKPVFIPTSLTIKQGDAVRFVVVATPPHNVMFPADSIPANAAAVLGPAMEPSMGPLLSALNGRMLLQNNEAVTLSFAGAPPGRYVVHCFPHIQLGMRMEITVQ